MILSSMTIEERFAEVREVNQRIQRVAQSANIAGGYVRDAIFGNDASDIDVWVPIRYYRSAEARYSLVQRLGEALDQYGFRIAGDGNGYNDRDNPNAPQMGAAAQVAYEADGDSFFNRGGFNKLQVIFTGLNSTHSVHEWFHCNLAMCALNVIDGEPYATPQAQRDFAGRTITLTADALDQPPVRIARYVRKIQNKYPGYRVMMPGGFSVDTWQRLYSGLLQEGVLNAPTARQVVPPQTQIFNWDEVRLDDGEAALVTPEQAATLLRDARDALERSRREDRDRARLWARQWSQRQNPQVGAQAVTNTVPDEAGVQSRLLDPTPTPLWNRAIDAVRPRLDTVWFDEVQDPTHRG